MLHVTIHGPNYLEISDVFQTVYGESHILWRYLECSIELQTLSRAYLESPDTSKILSRFLGPCLSVTTCYC